MIKLHIAESALSMTSRILSNYALEIWIRFLNYSDTLIGYKRELDLDIVLAVVRQIDFDSDIPADPMMPIFEAYERGKIVATRLPVQRVSWITLCGHHSSIIPDRKKPIRFSSLGRASIGALALFEGGVNFVTRDGQIIRNEQWKQAEDYFLKQLYEHNLLF